MENSPYNGVRRCGIRQVVDLFEIPDDIDAGAAHMERLQFLYRGDRRYNVVLGEQALHTNIGVPDVMRGQLDRLLASISLPRLNLRISAAPFRRIRKPRPRPHRQGPGRLELKPK